MQDVRSSLLQYSIYTKISVSLIFQSFLWSPVATVFVTVEGVSFNGDDGFMMLVEPLNHFLRQLSQKNLEVIIQSTFAFFSNEHVSGSTKEACKGDKKFGSFGSSLPYVWGFEDLAGLWKIWYISYIAVLCFPRLLLQVFFYSSLWEQLHSQT